MQGPEPLSAHSFQLSVPSGSTPKYPEIGFCLTRNSPTRGLCLQPLWLSKSSRLPSFSLLPAATQTEFHSKQWGEREYPGNRAGWLLSVPFRPAAGFLFHPRHRGTSGGRAALGCLRAHHTRWKAMDPGSKPTKARESQLLGRRCALQPCTLVS